MNRASKPVYTNIGVSGNGFLLLIMANYLTPYLCLMPCLITNNHRLICQYHKKSNVLVKGIKNRFSPSKPKPPHKTTIDDYTKYWSVLGKNFINTHHILKKTHFNLLICFRKLINNNRKVIPLLNNGITAKG